MITKDLKLDRDLACADAGLIVGADGIKIDLNGHTIAGTGVGAGINLTGRTGVSVSGGTIANFFAGVLTNASTDIVIKSNAFVGNTDGVDLQAGSRGVTIRHNEFRDNRSRGIMIRGDSTEHTIEHNTFAGDRVGILVFAGVANTLRNNQVTASTLAGIRINVFATGNILSKNTVTSSPAGIEFLVSGTQSAVGNTVYRNTLESNTCGIKGPLGGNTVEKNHFKENVSDTCQ